MIKTYSFINNDPLAEWQVNLYSFVQSKIFVIFSAVLGFAIALLLAYVYVKHKKLKHDKIIFNVLGVLLFGVIGFNTYSDIIKTQIDEIQPLARNSKLTDYYLKPNNVDYGDLYEAKIKQKDVVNYLIYKDKNSVAYNKKICQVETSLTKERGQVKIKALNKLGAKYIKVINNLYVHDHSDAFVSVGRNNVRVKNSRR